MPSTLFTPSPLLGVGQSTTRYGAFDSSITSSIVSSWTFLLQLPPQPVRKESIVPATATTVTTAKNNTRLGISPYSFSFISFPLKKHTHIKQSATPSRSGFTTLLHHVCAVSRATSLHRFSVVSSQLSVLSSQLSVFSSQFSVVGPVGQRTTEKRKTENGKRKTISPLGCHFLSF